MVFWAPIETDRTKNEEILLGPFTISDQILPRVAANHPAPQQRRKGLRAVLFLTKRRCIGLHMAAPINCPFGRCPCNKKSTTAWGLYWGPDFWNLPDCMLDLRGALTQCRLLLLGTAASRLEGPACEDAVHRRELHDAALEAHACTAMRLHAPGFRESITESQNIGTC